MKKFSLSLSFDEVVESDETLLADLGLKNLCRRTYIEPQNTNLKLCTRSCGNVWISVILISGVDASKCSFHSFSFQNVLVREMMKSHSVLGLVIRLNLSHLHLSLITPWNVDRYQCWIRLFISRF